MPSSSSSDEDNANLLSAIDTSFISDDLFNGTKKKTKEKDIPKSQRSVDEVEDVFHSELNVPPAMQKHLGRKLSKIIEKSIEFVETEPEMAKRIKRKTSGIRLLQDSENVISLDQPEEKLVQIRPEIKPRQVEEDLTSDSEKVRLAAASSDFSKETSHWESRRKFSKGIFNYKRKKGILYLVEPETEFSAVRKKNNWDESKIAKFRRGK